MDVCIVKFDTGITDVVIADQFVEIGSTVIQPADPIRDGYTFLGWFESANLWDFNDPVAQDITLFAGWKSNTGTVTVTFDADNGTAPTTTVIQADNVVARPDDPTLMDSAFIGWYCGNNPWDFTKPVNFDLTLKAKWQSTGYKLIGHEDAGYYLITGYTGTPTDITIPRYINGTRTAVGIAAFSDCKTLTSVTVPEGVSVNQYAFRNCTNLKTVHIGGDLNAVGVFYGCSNL